MKDSSSDATLTHAYAAGEAGQRVLSISEPTVVRADTLRVGFGMDTERRATFVLAADGVVLGSHTYPTLELTSAALSLEWQLPNGTTERVALWPNPDPAQIARCIARAAPSFGAHGALELMRRADPGAQPIIDAALDALGLLAAAPSGVERPLRSLAPLLADPAEFLRSADSLASSPAKI